MQVNLILYLPSLFNFATFNTGINHTCTETMFGNDGNAYWACATQFALQSNWFPSPIAGLRTYQSWNSFYGFWQNGLVLETMANFMAYAHHTRYLSVVSNSYRPLDQLVKAYGPYPSFDDMAWYGLSYVRIYEVLGDKRFLDTATDIYNWNWKTGWDYSEACNGGFWFDYLKKVKVTIPNALMYQLGGKLFRLTKNKSFLSRTERVYHFISSNGIINTTTHLVADGINSNCTNNGVYGPSYLSGVLIGGSIEMYKITKNKSHITLAEKLAHATISAYSNSKGIFTEYCEPHCNDDAKMFKGIFVRNLRYLMDTLQDQQKRSKYQEWLQVNVMANTKLNICNKVPFSLCNITLEDGSPYFKTSGPVFADDWNGPFSYSAPMQQATSFDLFVSSIRPSTSCVGKWCTYDPPYPKPKPLTCADRVCPSERDCCQYQPGFSYECCQLGETCLHGFCV